MHSKSDPAPGLSTAGPVVFWRNGTRPPSYFLPGQSPAVANLESGAAQSGFFNPISPYFLAPPASMDLLLVTTRHVPASNSWTPPGRVAALNASPRLRELVGAALERHRTSVRQLSFLAQKQGFRVTRTALNQLRAGTYMSVPSGETLRAIAWLADVSGKVAFTSAGRPIPGPMFAEDLPPGVDNLSPKARRAAIDLLRILVDMNRDADEWQRTHEKVCRGRGLREAGFVSTERKSEEPDDQATPAPKLRAGKLIGKYADDADLEDQRRLLMDLSNLEDLETGELRDDDYPGNDIPLPEHYLDLAAHPPTDSSGRRENQAGRKRGEESEDNGGR